MAAIYNAAAIRKFVRAARTRRVGLAFVGDSNVLRSDMGYRTGHAVGNARALAGLFGVWGSGVLPGKAGTGNNFASSVNGFEKGPGNSLGWGSIESDSSHLTDAVFPSWEGHQHKYTMSSRSGGAFSVGETIAYRTTAWTYSHGARSLTKAANAAGAAMQGAQVYVVSGTGVTPGWYAVDAPLGSEPNFNRYIMAGDGLGAGADTASDIVVDQVRFEVVTDSSNIVTAKYLGGYIDWTGVTFTNDAGTKTGTAVALAATGTMATASKYTHYFVGPHGFLPAGATVPRNSNSLGGFIDQYPMDTGTGLDRRVLDFQQPWDWYLNYATYNSGSGIFMPTVRRLVSGVAGDTYASQTPTYTGVISVATSGGPFRPGETLTQETSGATARFIRESGGVLYVARIAGTVTTGSAKTWTGGVSSAVCTCSSMTLATVSTNTGANGLAIRNIPVCAGIKYKDGYYVGVTNITDTTNGGATGPVGILYNKFVNTNQAVGFEQSLLWHLGTQSLREFAGQLFDTTQDQWDAYFDMVATGQSGNQAYGVQSALSESDKLDAMLVIQISLGQNDATVESRDALNADGSTATGTASNVKAGHKLNWQTVAAFLLDKWETWGGTAENFCLLAGGMISSPAADSLYASDFEDALEETALELGYFCYVKGSELLTSAETRRLGLYGNQNGYATGNAFTEDSSHLSPGGFDLFGQLVWNTIAEASGISGDGTNNASIVFLLIEV